MNLAAPPTGVVWNYDRAEIIADGVVHAIGVALGVAGAAVLLAIAFSDARGSKPDRWSSTSSAC